MLSRMDFNPSSSQDSKALSSTSMRVTDIVEGGDDGTPVHIAEAGQLRAHVLQRMVLRLLQSKQIYDSLK